MKKIEIKKKQHSFKKAFTVGLIVLVFILTGLGFGIKSLFFKGDQEMMMPDDIKSDDQGSVIDDPYSEPPLASLKSGRILMDGFLSLTAKHDLSDFQNADELSQEMLISMGVWLAISDEKFAPDFKITADGEMKVPADIVKQEIAAKFNRTAEISDVSVDIYGTFNFNQDEKVYIVPVYGMEAKFIPRVKEIKAVEGGYSVTLDYLDATAFTEGVPADTSGFKVEKTVELTLQQGAADQPYKLSALKTIN